MSETRGVDLMELDHAQPDPRGPVLSTEQSNRIQARLEDKALEEAENLADEFAEWMIEDCNNAQALAITAALIRGTTDSIQAAKLTAWRLLDDYVQNRVANADADELARIEQETIE